MPAKKGNSNEKKKKHIYKRGARKSQLKSFEKRYGKKKGKYVYGATVGKLKRGG